MIQEIQDVLTLQAALDALRADGRGLVKVGMEYEVARIVREALAEQPAQGEVVAWLDFPEQVPDPDTECLVEVDTGKIRYRAVDTWEMQSECPVEWSSATIETGYDWSAYPGDVRRWIPISSITAPPAPSVPDDVAKDAARFRWMVEHGGDISREFGGKRQWVCQWFDSQEKGAQLHMSRHCDTPEQAIDDAMFPNQAAPEVPRA